MDSNRNHIDTNKFWRNHTCRKVRAGCKEDAEKVIINYELQKAKFIIIHIGIIDLEYNKIDGEIAKRIINIAMKLKKMYPVAEVMVSQITPRNDELQYRVNKINELLKNSLPQSIRLINNTNLTKDMLCDKKHIRKDDIGRLVGNIKREIRKTFEGRKVYRNQHVVNQYGKKEKEKHMRRRMKNRL